LLFFEPTFVGRKAFLLQLPVLSAYFFLAFAFIAHLKFASFDPRSFLSSGMAALCFG